MVAPRQALVALGCESVGNVDLEPDLCVGLWGKMESGVSIKMLQNYPKIHVSSASCENIIVDLHVLLEYTVYCGG